MVENKERFNPFKPGRGFGRSDISRLETEPQKPAEIVITKRADDFQAYLKSDPGVWGCGKSSYAAVGSLISAHADRFNIKITVSEDSLTQRHLNQD